MIRSEPATRATSPAPRPTTSPPAGPARRPALALLVLLTVVAVGAVSVPLVHAVTDDPAPSSEPSVSPDRTSAPAGAGGTAHQPTTRVAVARPGRGAPPKARPGTSSGDDGAVHGIVTVFDDSSAAVARLDPGLLHALRAAATDAAQEGVQIRVNSGWRSAAYQAQLLREAVAEYGSQAEAERWVATPETSAHVTGDAVDLGPARADSWLSRHGAAYGLCQIYRNEPWHFELRPAAVDDGCPAMYADPTQDPRMHQ